jgi:hypothetical protein
MSKMTLALRSTGVSLALCVAGATAASAFSYGILTVTHEGTSRGQAYGTFSRSGFNGASLASELRDISRDRTRTYVEGRGYGSGDYVAVQSGRRDDGGSTFAAMTTRYGYAAGSTSGFIGYVKVCQDVPLRPDWCSGSVSGRM